MSEVLDFTVNLSMLTSGNFNSSVGPAAQKLADLSSKMQKLNSTSKNIQGFQKQSQKLTELRAKLDAARTKVRDMQTVMRGGGQVDARLFTKANEEAARLQQQVQQNTLKLGEFRAALQGAGVDTSDLAGAQAKLQAQTDAMTRAQERLSAAQSRYSDLQGRLSWGNIKNDVLPAVASFKILQAPVKLAADFESAMARVKAVAFTNEGADLSQFEAMKAQAAQLGADTKFTAIEAAAAQENLARSGMSAPDIMAAMPALLNMAAAEDMDIGLASAIIAKGLGGMNLGGNMAGRLADILAYTSANSNTNIAMLGEAFKAAAPVAASQNINMEQLASYLGILANKGYEGSEAGNALSSSIQRLAKRPKQAADALDFLGVATRTKSGKMRELPDIMLALSDAMQKRNLGENQQLELMSKIFGGSYGAQMMAFMKATVSGDTERMQNGVYNDSFGRAEMMSNINLDTLNGQLAILGSAWDGVRITIGEMFSPIVRAGVEALSNALSKLNELMKSFPTVSKAVVLSFGALGAVRVAKSIWNIGSALVQLPGAWLEVARASNAAGQAVGAVSSKVSLIGSAFTWLKGVILGHPLIMLGTLAAGGVYLAIRHLDTIKAWWSSFVVPNVWEPLKGYASSAASWCMDKWAKCRAFMLSLDYAGMWQKVRTLADAAASWVGNRWSQCRDYLLSLDYSGMWNSAINAASSCVERLKSLWSDFMDWIMNAFDKLNPFNWEMPAWMKRLGGSSEQQVNNANVALGGYTPPEITPHAFGGIMTRPHVGLVAEAGPEAIIPLSNKSRGIPLVMQAAEMLGLHNDISNIAGDYFYQKNTSRASALSPAYNSVRNWSSYGIENFAGGVIPQVYSPRNTYRTPGQNYIGRRTYNLTDSLTSIFSPSRYVGGRASRGLNYLNIAGALVSMFNQPRNLSLNRQQNYDAMSYVNSASSLSSMFNQPRNLSRYNAVNFAGGVIPQIYSPRNTYRTPGQNYIGRRTYNLTDSLTSIFSPSRYVGGRSSRSLKYLNIASALWSTMHQPVNMSLNQTRNYDAMNSLSPAMYQSRNVMLNQSRNMPRFSNTMNSAGDMFSYNNAPSSAMFNSSVLASSLASDNSTMFNTTNTPSIKELNSSVNNYRSDQGSSYSTNNSRSVNIPAVNLTVNVPQQEGQSPRSFAMNIADEVMKVLRDITSLEERVQFA